jgi:translation initiation factor IF-2
VDGGTEQAMTFIDTPGHELFAAMRQRGARATDIIILVVAVDAGVQPTTEQAIEFARQMGTPLVVAINKMDRPDAQKLLPKITQQLLARGVVPEDMGGEVPLVGVSATKRLHLDRLREAVLLQAELLELRAESQGPAEGVVLEATVQKGLGVVANVLVQRGALKPSDLVVVGTTWGKIKTLTPTDVRASFALPLSAAECHGLLLSAAECHGVPRRATECR